MPLSYRSLTASLAHLVQRLNQIRNDMRFRSANFQMDVTSMTGMVEKGGLIFVFTGEKPETTEIMVPDALMRDDVSRLNMVVRWACHWTRAMENMLDTPHLPFVHRGTIGGRMLRDMKRDSKLELLVSDRSHGFQLTWELDGVGAGMGGLQWWNPNGMVLDISPGGRLYRQHIYCVPVSSCETDMFVIATRDFGLYNPVFKLFDYFGNRRIIAEDKAVVESSEPSEIPPVALERSVATDKPTLVFRNWYRQHIERNGPKKSLPMMP